MLLRGCRSDLRQKGLVLLLQRRGKLGISQAFGLLLALGDDELYKLFDGLGFLWVFPLFRDKKEGQASDRVSILGRCGRINDGSAYVFDPPASAKDAYPIAGLTFLLVPKE